jgi:uncharacterized protein YndB with AHSA1/START domain
VADFLEEIMVTPDDNRLQLAGDGAVELERLLQAPRERVWAALVDPSQAGTWFAASANIVPEPGGAYELFWQPGSPDHQSTVGCRITAIAPARYLAFTWRGPDELSAIMNEGDPPPPPTHVTITLAPVQGGTLLRVRHAGFRASPDWARARSWHERAWATCLDNLEAFLADRPLPRPWNE